MPKTPTPAPPQRGVPPADPVTPRRRSRRRLVLVARARQPRGDLVPRSREHLRRRDTRAARAAARARLRRDQEPRARDRRIGAGSRRPVGVHDPHPRRRAVRHSLPASPRDATGRRDSGARRERAWRGGHDYFALGGFEVAPDHSVLAYSIDLNGSERYTLRFRDMDSGMELDDVIADVTYGLAWADDSRTCFYVRPDEAMRPFEVWRHELGTPASADELVFREDDERFYIGVSRTRSGRFVFIDTSSKMTSEVWFVPSRRARPLRRAQCRRGEDGHEYDVEHHWSEERRRPVPDRHQPGRQGAQLRARRRAVSSIPSASTGRRSYRTART